MIFVSTGLSQDKGTLHQGFFNFKWDAEKGKIWLQLDGHWDEEFLYVNSLSAGVWIK